MNELDEFLDTDETRGRMNYVETDAEGNVRRTSVPVQEAEEAERAMQDGASKRDVMARFVDESGTGYLPVTSRMKEFHEKATAAGHRVAPVVTMVAQDDVVVDGSVLWKKGEERDVEAWSRAAEDDERTSARAKEQRELMAKLVAQGFVPKATLEPDKTAMWNAFKDLGAEAWTDPTGEKGTGEYVMDSLASGVATSAAKILGGAEKAIVGGVADVASLALRPFDGEKADRIQDIKQANAGIVDMATDFVVQGTAFDDMTKGVEGAKEALDTMGGVAEGVGGIVGMGAATKAIGAGVKATRAAQAIGQTAQEAGQIASKTALMLQMGAGGYENKRAELEQRAMEEGRTLTMEEQMRATAEGGKEALKSLLFGKLTGIGQKPMSQTNLAALEFGGMNAGDVVVDAFLDQTILRDGEAWNEAAKKMAWGFLEGGATSYLLSIGRAAGAASERIAKYREARDMERRQMVPETVRRAWTAWEVALKEAQGRIDERNAQILADALRVKYPTDPTTGMPGVVGIGTNGTVQMEDGSVVRPPVPERTNERGEVVEPGKPGEMVTADGVVLDEKGGMKTVVPGKVGPLAGGGYGVSVEIGVDPRTGLQKAPKETVRNAVVLLEEIADGSAKGEAVPVERIAEELPSLKSANAGGVGEGSRGKPVVVLEEENGNLVLVTGRGRLAEAKETGAETIQAVKLRATDGWTRDTARMVDVIDNVRNGTLAEEKTLVAAYSALGLGRAEAEALGMLRTPAQRGAFATVEKGGKTLIEAAANGVIGAEKAGAVAEALEAGRTGMDPSTMDRVEGELVPRVAGKAQRTVEQVAEALAEEIAKRGGKAPEGPELAKMVRAAIDEGERRAREERAERNGTTPEEEAKIESTPVETENGEIRTLEEVARKGESGKEPGKATERTWEVKVERGLQPTERPGEFRSAELPEVKATATEIEGPDGKAEEGVLLEGLTPEIVNGRKRTVLKILEEIIGSGKRVTTGDEATDRALAEIWDEAQGEREFARRTESEVEPLAASAQRMADGVFGTGAVKVRAGTVEEMKAALQEKDGNGGKLLRDGTGGAYGFWDPNAKEVVLFPGASARTVAHEVAWHAVREWAKGNRPELARKMDAWAAEAPEDVRRWVEENYKGAKADELLDEFGAHRLEGEKLKEFERILEKSPEAKKWYERLWEMVRECWRGMTGRNDVAKMSPDEAVDWLVRQIEEGRQLKAEKGRRTPDEGQKRFSRKKMSELAKVKVGGWIEGTNADGIRNAVEKRLETGLPKGEYRFRNADERKMIVKGALEFYKRFSQKTVFLSDGRCVYFVPDARARDRGLTNEEAWAEYAIHAVTSSGRKLEGKEYSERLYNETKRKNIWRIEDILKAERCELQEPTMDRSPGIVFYGKGVDGKVVRIITRMDEANNIYADLAEVTIVNVRGKKGMPPHKPLAEVVGAAQYRGGLPTDDAESLTQGELAVNGEKRLKRGEADELPGRRGTEAILIGGRRRMTRAGAGTEAGENGQRTAEYAERSDAGMAAGAELETTRWRDPHSPSATRYEGMALSTSELVKLYRDIQGTPGMPRVMMAESGKPWLGRVVRRNGKVQLDREMFGLVDESDRVAEKNDLKAAGGRGSFRHEDPTWALAHSAREVEAERNISEMRLEGRLEGLAERRVDGTETGGGRAERAVLAHEIGHLVCMMPDIRPAGTARSMQTLGKLVIQRLEQAELTRVRRNRAIPGLNAEAVDFKRHALEAVKWWRGFEGEGNEGGHGTPGTRRFEEYFAKNDKELYAEVFGMFLAAPRALEQRAPDVYAAIRDSIAHNDTMIRAFNDLRAVRRGEGEHERVMREIEAQWTIEAQRDVDRLERDLDKPVHGRIGDWKLHVGLNMGSAEAPAVMVTSWQVKAKIAEAKRNWKRGLISKNDYETIRKDLLDELAEMKLAVLVKQRGGGQDRIYALDFLNKVIEQSTEEGVAVNDLRRYLQAQRVIEVQGRAMMAGIDARQARRILDDMKARLGNEGWNRVEAAAKRFQALREKNVLDNEWVREAFGDDLVNYWRSNAHYVTTRRTMSQEEAVRYRMARERWARLHPGETDVLGDIEALMQIHRSGSGASHGTTFLKPLQGSFRMNEDPLKATLENDLRIMMFARRNHFALTLADAAAKLRMPGFEEHADRGGVKWAVEGERYGTVGFMRDGERRVLVMPKAVAEGFKYAPSEVGGLIKLNRMLSAVLTQYSPRFALRNIFRNRATNEINIPWMQEGRVVTAARLAGMGPMARLGEFLLERAMVRLPDRAARNALMNVLYGEKTNMYWIAEATRIAKMMYDPHGIREKAKRADQLAAEGKYGEAQRLLDDLARAKELMKHPIFAGTWRMMKGTTDRTDLDAVFRGLDLETNVDGTPLSGLGKVKAWIERKADTVRRFNSFEECRIKVIALLAAERAKMRAQAKGREFFSGKEVDYMTATMSGSPRYENRGRWMNVLEATFLGPFANVGMKGAQRTLESMRIDPGAWWRKASGRILGRIASTTLWTAGGYALVAAIARRIFSDDEEAQRKIDAFEDWGKRQSQALANVSDYRLRNYDIVPVGMFGRYCTFGISLPRGDEDRMLMPFVDMATKAMLGTDTAKELGLGDPIDATYSWQEAFMNATVNSGLMPDIMRGSMFWNVGKDTLYAWMVGSPYNTFTQRTTYEQKMWDARWEDPVPALKAMGKQLYNDLGGGVVMPASTWDEDEGSVPEEGTWVMPVADGEKIPVKGSTIFQALHYVPFASSMLSGVFFVATDGDKRIQRRIDKLSKEEKALRDQVAMRCLDRIMEIGAEANVDDILAEAKEKYQLDDVDWAIVNKALVGKVRKLAKETGNENEPILKIPSKVNEKTYRRLRRYLTNVGYEEEDE